MNRYTPFLNFSKRRPRAPCFPEDCCHICGADKMFFAESLPSDILQVQRCIGKGAFGSVHEGLYYNGRVAVKQLKRDMHHLGQPRLSFSKNDVQRMEKEARILRSLKHPNILHVYAFTYNPPQIITEFCMNGSLRRNLNLRTELVIGWKRKLKLLKGVVAGMRYLHERDVPICHRDLKSENILIGCDGEAIICDVGLSMYLTDDDLSRCEAEFSGSLNCTYQPPEVVLYKKYSEKSDVYSVGMIMWELITGQSPFGNRRTMSHLTGYQFHQHLKTRVVSGERPEIPDEMGGSSNDIPVGYIQLMKLCWSQNPENRPTFAEFDTLVSQMWKACEEEAGLKLLVPEPIPMDITQLAKRRKRRRGHFNWPSTILAFSGVAAILGQKFAIGTWMHLTLKGALEYSTVGLGLLILIETAIGKGIDCIKDRTAVATTSGELKLLEASEKSMLSTPFKQACPSSLLNLRKRSCSWFGNLRSWQDIHSMFQERAETPSEPNGSNQAIWSEIQSFCNRNEQLPTEEEWLELRQKLKAYTEATEEAIHQPNEWLFSSNEDSLGGPSIPLKIQFHKCAPRWMPKTQTFKS